jgi:hypothetical protein
MILVGMRINMKGSVQVAGLRQKMKKNYPEYETGKVHYSTEKFTGHFLTFYTM